MLFVRNLSKSYGAVTVLDNISFVVNHNDRVGIVGSNGVGKTTLLSILVGHETPDSGSFSFAPSTEVGYLPQTTPEFYGRTMQDLILESVGNLRQLEDRMHALETAMSAAYSDELASLMEEYDQVSSRFQDRGGYDLDYKKDTILEGLRISYLPRDREMKTLSGGEKERVGLATLLLRSPDLLLLDEPTNHLDFASLEWLESYLPNYKEAILLVSHHRQVLKSARNQIFWIDEDLPTLKKDQGNNDAHWHGKGAECAKGEAG